MAKVLGEFSLKEHLFYAGIFFSMSLIVIFCFLLVNRDNSSSSSSLSSAQLSYYDGGKKWHVDNILHKLSANYQMIRQYLLYLSGEFVLIVCTEVSKCLIVYFPDDVCPRLSDPYNGRVHLTGLKYTFQSELRSLISTTLIYFFFVFPTPTQ